MSDDHIDINEKRTLRQTRYTTLDDAERKTARKTKVEMREEPAKLRSHKQHIRFSERFEHRYEGRMFYSRMQHQRATANMRFYIILFVLILTVVWIVFRFL